MIQEIKDFINQNIKENGKGGITGTILNSVLNKIADWMQTAEKKVSAKKTLSGIFRLRSTEECDGNFCYFQDILYLPWLKDVIKENEDSTHFLEIDWTITDRNDLTLQERNGYFGYSQGSYTLKTKAYIYQQNNYLSAEQDTQVVGYDGQAKGGPAPNIHVHLFYCNGYNDKNHDGYKTLPRGESVCWLSIESSIGSNGSDPYEKTETWTDLYYGAAFLECRFDKVVFDGEEVPLEQCVLANNTKNYYDTSKDDSGVSYPFYPYRDTSELYRPLDDYAREYSTGTHNGKFISFKQNGAVTTWQKSHTHFLRYRNIEFNLPTLKSNCLTIAAQGALLYVNLWANAFTSSDSSVKVSDVNNKLDIKIDSNLLGAMQGKSVCRQTTADGYAVMASIFLKDDSSLGDYDDYDKCVLVFGYAGQDNDGHIKEFGELTIDLRNGFDLTYSGSNKSELKVKKYDGIMSQSTISIMSNCKANEFRALYLKSSVQIDAKQTEPILTFNVPASKGYITAVVADSSVQGQSFNINQIASVAEQIADRLPYANPFYYSDYSTDYYDAETQTLTLLEGKTMAHIYPTEPLMVKHIVLPEVKTGQRLAIYGNWIPVVEDGDEQEGRFSSAWRTDVANGFEDLIYLNGQWINKA